MNITVAEIYWFELENIHDVVPELGVEEQNTQKTAADDYGTGILDIQNTASDKNCGVLPDTQNNSASENGLKPTTSGKISTEVDNTIW